MDYIVIDIETRSACDLKKAGLYVYASDPTTLITHVGYKNGQGGVRMWRPPVEPIPNQLADALADERVTLVAHNAGFERLLMGGHAGQTIGIPEAVTVVERWSCTAARAAHICLPRALDAACRALNLPFRKDLVGHSLMIRVSKPRTVEPLRWWDDETRMARIGEYCSWDVIAEAELHRVLPALSEAELAVWRATEAMNDTGVAIDQVLLHELIEIADAARRGLDEEMSALTGGAVPRVSNAGALTRWLISQGVNTEGAARSDVEMLLDSDIPLEPKVLAALELRRDGGGSSSHKALAIGRQLSPDGRIRGSMVYAGAVSTGRWSSHGAQLQNLPRHNPDFNSDWLLRDVAAGATPAELQELHGPPLKMVSELLRPLLVSDRPDQVLVAADYSQVEVRVLAWLSGEEGLLDVFRAFDAGNGPDPYRVAAAAIFGVSVERVTAEQRKIGKVSVLALGYGGGERAFRAMGKNYGVKVSADQAEGIKQAWRLAHPNIVEFWSQLERGARDCTTPVRREGHTVAVGRVEWRREKHAITLKLPSGRRLVYWNPTLKERETPWGAMRTQAHFMAQDAMTKRWSEFGMYGGLAVENATQSVARDLLADALVRLDRAGLNPVLTIHDEVVCQTASAGVEKIRDIMMTPPAWAERLPVAVDIGAGPRYSK